MTPLAFNSPAASTTETLAATLRNDDMSQIFDIKLVSRFRKPIEGNRLVKALWFCLWIIIYPIVILVGILWLFVIIISGLFQNIIMTKTQREKKRKEDTLPVIEEQWSTMTAINKITFFKKFAGEIRMYGPTYFKMKTEPKSIDFGIDNYGDWFYYKNNGLFLQKWNSTDKPNTDLIFIDTNNFEKRIIEKNIPSVLWDMVELEDESLQLNCDTGREIISYKIEIKKSSS